MPFYLDDGTEINPDELKIPEKCLKCRHYTVNNFSVEKPDELCQEWEDNVMCILTRIDQLDEKDFFCREYIHNPKWKTKIS